MITLNNKVLFFCSTESTATFEKVAAEYGGGFGGASGAGGGVCCNRNRFKRSG